MAGDVMQMNETQCAQWRQGEEKKRRRRRWTRRARKAIRDFGSSHYGAVCSVVALRSRTFELRTTRISRRWQPSSSAAYRLYASALPERRSICFTSFVVFLFLFLRESQLPEGDRWLAETRHVTTVGRPAVSCPLKSSARGRPQHQTLVSVPPSQFWYIDADERQRKKKTKTENLSRCILFESLFSAQSSSIFSCFNTS